MLGAGRGKLAADLCRTWHRVVVVDSERSRLLFVRKRLAERGFHNVDLIQGDTTAAYPFRREQFGLVSLGEYQGRDGLRIRERIEDASSLLEPQGFLQVIVGNSLYPFRVFSFFGSKYCKSKTLDDLHTLPMYRRIFGQMGFHITSVHIPLPDHRTPPMFYVPAEPSPLRYFFKRLFPLFAYASPEVKRQWFVPYLLARWSVKAACLLRVEGLARFFASGYLVLAKKVA